MSMETPLLNAVIERAQSRRWSQAREDIFEVVSRSGGNVFPLFADGIKDSIDIEEKYLPILRHYDVGEAAEAEILIENLIKDEIKMYIPSRPRNFEPKALRDVAAAFAMHFHNRALISIMLESNAI